MTKRMPAKVMGGKSARTSLMNSHVDPQIQQRISQTMRAFIYLFVREVSEDVKASGKRGSSPTVREGVPAQSRFIAGNDTRRLCLRAGYCPAGSVAIYSRDAEGSA